MKKILSVLSSLTIVGATVATVIACSTTDYFKDFEKKVNNDETFIMAVSSSECPNCQINDLTLDLMYDNKSSSSEVFKDELTSGSKYNVKEYYNSNGIDEDIDHIVNSTLLYTGSNDENDVWSDSWGEELGDWILNQERNREENLLEDGKVDQSITKSTLGIDGVPFFIYIRKGEYVGFEKGAFGSEQGGGEEGKVPFLDAFWEHIVLGQWITPGR